MKTKVSKNLLFELERFCNNYFNPRNDPNDPARKYPPAFLELAKRIEAYAGADGKPAPNVTSESKSVDGVSRSVSYAGQSAWQAVFSRELSIWKRVRFI